MSYIYVHICVHLLCLNRLALTDVIPMCNLNTLSLWRRLLLRAAFFISGIPADNIFGAHLEGYKNSLQRAG